MVRKNAFEMIPCSLANALLAIVLSSYAGTMAIAQEDIPAPVALRSRYAEHIRPLLETYCIQCHDEDMASKSGVRLDTLEPDLAPGNIDTWTRVKNVLDVGSMPPKGKERPTAGEQEALLAWIGGSLGRYDAEHKETGGDTLIRRLNNRAYANIIKTLLGVPAQGIESFPADGAVRGFDTVGAGLYTTTYLYDLYLKTAKQTLDRAIPDRDQAPEVKEYRHQFTSGAGHILDDNRATLQDAIRHLREDPAHFVTTDMRQIQTCLTFKLPDVPATLAGMVRRNPVAEVVAGHYGAPSIEAVDAQGIDWARDPQCASEIALALEVQIEQLRKLESHLTEFKFMTVGPFDGFGVGTLTPGYYQVSVRLCLSNPDHPLPVGIMVGDGFVSEFMLYDAPEAPGTYQQVVYWDPRWTKVAVPSLLPYNGDGTSKTVAFATGYLLNYIKELYGLSGPEVGVSGGAWGLQSHFWTHLPTTTETGRSNVVPTGILCSEACVRGPLNESWPPPAAARIFTRGLKAAPSRAYAEEIVTEFMKRAYVVGGCDDEMTRPYVDLIMASYASSPNFIAAVKFGLSAILSSPQFLYLDERQRADASQRRPLAAFELARRLAYFLWSDLPDDELAASAASGALANPTELLAQTRRMIKDARSRAFREAFTAQWLKIDKVPKIAFLNDQFPSFDNYLQRSAVEESVAFFSELLDRNLSVADFIDSDFLMLNGRMAQHYGIAGVTGNEFRRVPRPPGSHRGGVLTQASVLMATSNGMVGSQVRRGALIMERLLGVSPGVPPPNVPALDKIKTSNDDGSPLSPSERLALHRTNQSCARCHGRIDPLGQGLENFNALGAWNAKVRILLPEISKKTHSIWAERDADARGTMLDGKPYDGPDELKQRLAEHQDAFTRTLAECLLIYSLGRELEQSDRPTLDRICSEVSAEGGGLATLVERLVGSDVFRDK